MATDDVLSSRFTPLDKNYPTCEETVVELVISTEGTFDEITEILKIRPSEAQNKGQVLTNSIGHPRVAKRTLWILSSDGEVQSKDVRHHLNWLLDKIEGAASGIKKLQETPDVIMYVKCVWFAAGMGGPTLWPEQMEKLAKHNLECTFSFYGPDDTSGVV